VGEIRARRADGGVCELLGAIKDLGDAHIADFEGAVGADEAV